MSQARPSRRLLPFLLLACLLLLSLTACTSKEEKENVVATYSGGKTITRDELEHQFRFQRQLIDPQYEASVENKRAFLDEYILLHKVLIAKAEQQGIQPDVSDLDEQVNTYKRQVTDLIYHGDGAAFAKRLQAFGITDDDLRQLVTDDATLRAYKAQVTGDPKPTAAELQAYYDRHRAEFATGTLSQILVESEADALAVKSHLDAGADFATEAKKFSRDVTAKQTGGRMVNADFSRLVEGLRKAAATLPLKTVSPPILSDYGWHLVKVEQRTIPTFAAIRGKLTAKLTEEKQNVAWNAFTEQARQEAQITLHL
ncbi:MAG TPA: peptidyl-prolyl cis-trans isomerase [Bacilli bacterium]|nr:peptidyl-prolyl cis-trans isomerase [Bacilli bacterium]